MGDVVAVQVFNSCNQLPEDSAGLRLGQPRWALRLPFLSDDQPEQLTPLQVLSHQQQALLGLDDLVEVHDVAMADLLEDGDLVLDSLLVFGTHALLVDDFDGHLLVGWDVHGQVHLAECPLPDVLA